MSGRGPCTYYCLGPVVKLTTQTTIPGLEKCIPFDDQQTTSAPAAGAGAALAVMSPARDTRPPPFTPSAQQLINTEQLHRQRQELERGDEQLRRQEGALSGGQLNARKSNGDLDCAVRTMLSLRSMSTFC